jgi:hypothetical protein
MPLGIAWAGLKWRAFVRGAGAGKKCAATGKCRGLGRHSVGPVEPGPTPGSSVTSRGTAVSDNHELLWVEKLPEEPFDVTKDLARWRELRDMVVPAEVAAQVARASMELTASQTLTR